MDGVHPDLEFTPHVTSYPSSINMLSAVHHSTVMNSYVKEENFPAKAISENRQKYSGNCSTANEKVSSKTDLHAKMVSKWQ